MKHRIGKIAIALVLALSSFGGMGVYAQSIDPTLAAMIALYSSKAEKTLKSQEKAMLLETTGHIWIKEEVDEVYQLDKEFNEYLDSFRGIVVYAAQIYGFYQEIDKLVDNMQNLTEKIADSPGNAVAVALSANRNKTYREVITKSVEIVNDIRTVCLADTKMTEKERIETLFGIRPKLKDMNTKLSRLIRAVKYTSMGDVWDEISGRQPAKADIPSISEAAFQRWRRLGKNVRP